MDPKNNANTTPVKPPAPQFRPPSNITNNATLSFLPLGGIEDVTKNMYLYTVGDEILIVDCGLGFADETMLGVDLLVPDISALLSMLPPKGNKKIVGLVLTHGHEDHIGGLPFILPQLPKIPVYGTPLTAALANEKLKEFRTGTKVNTFQFNQQPIKLGNNFTVSFIRVTHSVPDSSNIYIKTPAGNYFHTGDFKMDMTPADGKRTDYLKITKAQLDGVTALFSDSLGAERRGFNPSEIGLEKNFETAMRDITGKVLVTTYSSNINRLNQAINAASKYGRKICFVGRSLIKATAVAKQLGYMNIPSDMEIGVDQIKNYDDHELLLFVAGSQGQENSALSRVAGDEHREIELFPQDLVIFSADTIPGNEVLVRALLDDISKKGCKVLYSDITHDFHVSGHGAEGDIMLMMSLVGAKFVVPISGAYTGMVAYKELAKKLGYKDNQIIFLQNGQEFLFTKETVKKGKKYDVRNVYVDEISGEEVESFVLRDRERLAREGVIIVMVEIDSQTGKLINQPEIVVKGFSPKEVESLNKTVEQEIRGVLDQSKNRAKNSVHSRRQIEDAITRHLQKTMQRKPLVLPVVIEV